MPRYIHDCNSCRFLGSLDRYDLYVCQSCDNTTVLARYGSEPSAYASRGFMAESVSRVLREIGGLEHDEAIVIAIFRELPSLVLNIWKREEPIPPTLTVSDGL